MFSRLSRAVQIEKECRICLDQNNQNDMISPCVCAGSSKYVHRACLEEFEKKKPAGIPDYTCTVCKRQYKMVVPLWARILSNKIVVTSTYNFCASGLFSLAGEMILRKLGFENASVYDLAYAHTMIRYSMVDCEYSSRDTRLLISMFMLFHIKDFIPMPIYFKRAFTTIMLILAPKDIPIGLQAVLKKTEKMTEEIMRNRRIENLE